MKDQLAIAVDFGTTYSGVAYMPIHTRTSHGMPLINPIQLGTWPGQPPTRQSYKVPTIVSYPSDPNYPPLWGFNAERPPHMGYPGVTYQRVRAFKMFLEPATTKFFEAPPGKTLKDVVHDFLEGVYQHLIVTLQGEGLSTDELDYEVLFTVPAPFSKSAVENFRRIVMGTGWGSHKIELQLTEPEAAALYTLRTQPVMRRPDGFQMQQCFIVCDAGGGTVDLSSYSLVQLQPVMKVEQTGIIDGGVFGSTIVDKAFQRFLKTRLGEDTIGGLTDAEKAMMMDGFVEQKERFADAMYEDNINIRLPRDDVHCPGKRGGYLPISREEMKSFFEMPVSNICGLVAGHIQGCRAKGYQVSYIFLVGGFGTSPYLKTRLEQHLRQIDPNIQIIKPPDAQQSVVLGSLYTQLQRLRREEDPISVRLCRAHFGILAAVPFDPAIHHPGEAYTHPVTKIRLARDQVMWLIRKGERITETTAAAVERALHRSFKRSVTNVWFETLVQSSADVPPTRLEPGVQIICRMASDLRNCQRTEFEKKMSGKSKWCGLRKSSYYEAAYKVRVLIGADLQFEMFMNDRIRSELLTISWDALGDANAT